MNGDSRNSRFRAAERIMASEAMHPLHVERQTVHAEDVFHSRESWQSIRQYSIAVKESEQLGAVPDPVAAINRLTTPDGYLPEALTHQDVTGSQSIMQARLMAEAAFMKAIASHPEFKVLPGSERQLRLLVDTGAWLNSLMGIGNFFRSNKIHTVRGSGAEMSLVRLCFGTMWPGGIELYGILREMYPAFHAFLTGQIPLWVAENMEGLLEKNISCHTIFGLGRFAVDRRGRFMGLYPVAAVPAGEVTLDSPFVAQDQFGRRAVVSRILSDAGELLKRSPDRTVLVIDYAGGVGNLSELLLRAIYGIADTALKDLLLANLRTAVIDVAGEQLAAGRNRFDALGRTAGFDGINERILFMAGDVTRALTGEHLRKLSEHFGRNFFSRSVCLGMTAYTIGALAGLVREDGLPYPDAMADEMHRQCYGIYATDFSAPMWRMEGFLRDTGRWGREYLRTMHGSADPEDEQEPPGRLLSAGLRMRYGLAFKSTADYIRFMAAGPGLAANYITLWPGSLGHSSGYSILEDGTLKKPGILSFAERLQAGPPTQSPRGSRG
ncbi:MAG: hypothetical protein WCQ99_10905, partial [Pseudomonadota bacterium]